MSLLWKGLKDDTSMDIINKLVDGASGNAVVDPLAALKAATTQEQKLQAITGIILLIRQNKIPSTKAGEIIQLIRK